MKKLILCLFVFGLMTPCTSTFAQVRSDKPKRVIVKTNTSKGYIEVTVIANKKK